MTCQHLNNILGSRDKRTVPSVRATVITRGYDGEGIRVSYHGTTVVIAHQDGSFTLNSGGYRTSTTKARINDYSNAQVYQKNYKWFVTQAINRGHLRDGDVVFYGGMRIDAGGNVVERA